MAVHKLVQGGEQWLPFALSKLRALATLAPGMGGYASQTFPMPDGATVSVRIEGAQQFLHITGQPQAFEFYTSGYPITTTTLTQGSLTATAYDVGIVSARTTGAGRFRSKFVLNKKLSYAPGKTDGVAAGRFNWQVQLGPIPFVDVVPMDSALRKFRYTMAHTHTPNSPHTFAFTAMPVWSGHWGGYAEFVTAQAKRPMPISSSFATRDFGYDVTPTYTSSRTMLATHQSALHPESDWPRQSSIQYVKDARGDEHGYAVYVDATGNFFACPVDSLGTVNADAVTGLPIPNLTSTNSKKATPAYPGWVWRGEAPTTPMKDQVGGAFELSVKNPEFKWEFNHDGKKAATIAYRRVPFGGYDAAFIASQFTDPEQTPPNIGDEATFSDYLYAGNAWWSPMFPHYGMSNVYGLSDLPEDRHYAGAGILEANIIIAITDNQVTDPNDFTFQVNITSVRAPTDEHTFPVAVGYLWHDIPDYPNVGKGALLLVDVDVRSNILPDTLPDTLLYALANGNTRAQYEANMRLVDLSNGGAVIFHGMRGQIRSYDLRTMSFYLAGLVIELQGASQTAPLNPNSPDPGAPVTDAFTEARPWAAVVVRGLLKKVFLPEDIPAALTVKAQAVAMYATDDVLNAAYAWPAGAVPLRTNTVYAGDNLRRILLGDEWNDVSDAEALDAWEKYAKLIIWFSGVIKDLLVSSVPPADLGGYPIGWLMSAYMVSQRLAIPAFNNIFYVHPNGSWAVFDNNRFFNTLGVPRAGSMMYSAETGTLLTSDHFKWFVVDEVQIRTDRKKGGAGAFKSTTFLKLYNDATQNHIDTKAVDDPQEFQDVTQSSIQPAIDLDFLTVEWLAADGITVHTPQVAVLHFTMGDGSSMYRVLPAFRKGGLPDAGVQSPTWPEWCLSGDLHDTMHQDAACENLLIDGLSPYQYPFRISSPRLVGHPKKKG